VTTTTTTTTATAAIKVPHMDPPQYNGAKPPEGSVDTACWAPPPAKKARLELCEGGGAGAGAGGGGAGAGGGCSAQHESSGSGGGGGGQGSPSAAKSPVLVALKSSTPPDKSWHKRGKVAGAGIVSKRSTRTHLFYRMIKVLGYECQI